jgi:hypothetical protein
VGYGRIISVISISVRQPIKGLGVSSTVREAVASWAQTLAGGALRDYRQQRPAGRDRDRAAELGEAAGQAAIASGASPRPRSRPRPSPS